MDVAGQNPAPGGRDLHLLFTDSGLGGLAVCAGLEARLRSCTAYRHLRLTFFNAAADPQRGYNDLSDPPDRAALLDRALRAMDALHPDRIILACNTLSVLYEHTAHARRGQVPVTGIIEAGLNLFHEALAADPGGMLLLLGTRTTIDSGIHRERLLQLGVAPERIAAISCHGLARAIESDPEGREARQISERCAAALPALGLHGDRLYAGLACTHYGFAGRLIREVMEQSSGLPVRLLDPNEALADEIAAVIAAPGCGGAPTSGASAPSRGNAAGLRPARTVRVLSKVRLPETSRRAIAGRLGQISDLSARALLSYAHDPDLF